MALPSVAPYYAPRGVRVVQSKSEASWISMCHELGSVRWTLAFLATGRSATCQSHLARHAGSSPANPRPRRRQPPFLTVVPLTR